MTSNTRGSGERGGLGSMIPGQRERQRLLLRHHPLLHTGAVVKTGLVLADLALFAFDTAKVLDAHQGLLPRIGEGALDAILLAIPAAVVYKALVDSDHHRRSAIRSASRVRHLSKPNPMDTSHSETTFHLGLFHLTLGRTRRTGKGPQSR